MVVADYYELLGVRNDASAEDLKRAYRRKARELHPDANPGDAASEEQFKQVARAYEVLSDPELRSRYDRFGEQGVSGAGAANGGDVFGGGLGDIFEAFFGGATGFGGGGGGSRRGGPMQPPRGQDLEVRAELPFRDAVFGATLPVNLRTYAACDACGATGAGGGTKPVMCVDCDGSGQVRRVRQNLFGQMVTAAPCGRCGGLGQVVMTPCPTCNGEGRRLDEPTLTIEVPAGVDDGTTLRLAGRGAVGPRGGAPGDLYVHLRVRPDERFQRDGTDLVAPLRISLAQATLGTHVVFETLDGAEDLVVAPGTQHGREFVLKGRGVPHVQGRGRGDLRVVALLDVPTKLSRAEEDLLRQFAEERGEVVSPPDQSLLGRIKSAFR
jgi:molecular chaperone DnaJ